MKIEKIKSNEMVDYVSEKFQESNKHISRDSISQIVQLCDNIPYYVQFLSFQVWQLLSGKVTKNEDKIISEAVDMILHNQSDYYYEILETLTAYQKKVLRALTISKVDIFSKKYSQQFKLSSSSSTQRAISKLIETGIIEKEGNLYSFSDPFFMKFVSLRYFA